MDRLRCQIPDQSLRGWITILSAVPVVIYEMLTIGRIEPILKIAAGKIETKPFLRRLPMGVVGLLLFGGEARPERLPNPMHASLAGLRARAKSS
jgi:hypothetical protein